MAIRELVETFAAVATSVGVFFVVWQLWQTKKPGRNLIRRPVSERVSATRKSHPGFSSARRGIGEREILRGARICLQLYRSVK